MKKRKKRWKWIGSRKITKQEKKTEIDAKVRKNKKNYEEVNEDKALKEEEK